MIVVSSTAVHVLLVARDSSKLDMAMACAAHDRHQVGAPGGNHQGPGVTKKNIHQMVSAKDLHVLSLIASASLSGLHNHACCHKIEHSYLTSSALQAAQMHCTSPFSCPYNRVDLLHTTA